MSSNFTRYQRIIIYVFRMERTVPNTIRALEQMTGQEYKHKSYVRDTIREYKKTAQEKFVNDSRTVATV